MLCHVLMNTRAGMLQVLPHTNEHMYWHAAAIVDHHGTVNLYLSLVLTARHTLERKWIGTILHLH